MIEVNNLIFDYPNHRALDNVSFKIKEGSITALVGPNGAGKTTLLKCIAALEVPYSGSIKVDGIDIIKTPRVANKLIGFMPDFFGLYDSLTVRQAITYYGSAYKIAPDEIEKRLQSLLESLNLSNKIDEKVSSLSRGMRQRLAIGQAIIHKPKLLILDEPASGLDPEARSSLSNLFLELNASGMTIIVSSHILAELDDYANDLIILKDGNVTKQETEEKELQMIRKVSLSILAPFEEIKPSLEEIENIKEVKADGDEITISFYGGDKEQYKLLKELIERNIPVAEFYIKKTKLQDQYLDLVKN